MASARLRSMYKGDLVKVIAGPQKGLTGTVVYVGSGPSSDQVSVDLDHPVWRVAGPAILRPQNLKVIGRRAHYTEGASRPEKSTEFHSPWYAIEASDMAKIDRVRKRLYTEDRLNGNEMRDLAHVLSSVLNIVRQFPINP